MASIFDFAKNFFSAEARRLAKAESLYKSAITKTFKERGLWRSEYKFATDKAMVEGADFTGLSVKLLSNSGEELFSLSRMFSPERINLSTIDVASQLRQRGIAKSIYESEQSIFRRLGYKPGTRVESPVVSPYTEKLQRRVYGSEFLRSPIGAPTRIMEGRIPGFDDAYNTIEGLPHGGMAEVGRKKNTPFGSGLVRTLFGSMDEFLKASPQEMYKRLGRWVKETPDVAFERSSEVIGTRFKNDWIRRVISFGKAPATKIFHEAGISSPHKSSYAVIFAHEASEAHYMGTLLQNSQRRGLYSPQDTVERFMKNRTGSHSSAGVLGDELLIAAKTGPQAYNDLLALRMDEFSWIAKTKDPRLHKYANRSRKVISTFEKKWLPRIAGSDDRYNTIEGLSHKGISGWLRKIMTAFGSGYQGQDRESFKFDRILALGAAGGIGAYLASSKGQWINVPLGPDDYINRFLAVNYKPGDIITSRNVLYDEPFHQAIIGADKKIYEAYPGADGKAIIHQHTSMRKYLEDQLALHGKEGLDYPLYGVARRKGLSAEQREQVGRKVVELFKQYERGEYKPVYGLATNRGLNEINCLSFASEAHKEVGKSLFKEGTSWAVPWNVNYSDFDWRVRGPERLSAGIRFGKYSSFIGAASFGVGAATMDPTMIAYGAAAFVGGFGFDALSKTSVYKASALGGLGIPESTRLMFRKGITSLGYAALTFPLAYKMMDIGSEMETPEAEPSTILKAGALAGLGITAWGVTSAYQANKMAYSEAAQRVLILADVPTSAAGHWTPSLAVKEWLGHYGWDADVVGGLDDLSKLQRQGRSYRAFIDAGYNAQWVRGLPGLAVQWDVQGLEAARTGQFRMHVRPGFGMESEGMVFVTPRKEEKEIYEGLVRKGNIYEMNTLVVRPHVLKRAKALRRQFEQGTLELPNVAKGEKYITISGGGKGFGVPEAVRTLQESKWLEETGHKAIVFASKLEEQRPSAFAELKKMIAKDPHRFLLYDAAPGSPGGRLPEYMTGATVNIFAPGASTTVEGVVSGRPFIGISGGGIPPWAHFETHPLYAQERYGALAETLKVPELSANAEPAARLMREKLISLAEQGKRPVRIPAYSEFDVGKTLINIIKQGEAAGQLKPAGFRPTIQSIVYPLVASDVMKTRILAGLGVTAVSAAGLWLLGKDDDKASQQNLSPGVPESPDYEEAMILSAKRKQRFYDSHANSVRMASRMSNKGGRGHMDQTGKIVV